MDDMIVEKTKDPSEQRPILMLGSVANWYAFTERDRDEMRERI